MGKDFKEISRGKWVPHDTRDTVESIKVGCQQRMADAAEAMAKNHNELISNNKYLNRRFKEEQSENEYLRKRSNALKGHVTRLKREIKAQNVPSLAVPDPYLRLLNSYRNNKNIYVAYDVHGTILYGEPYVCELVIDLIKRCQKLGFILIAFTCNEGEDLNSAIEELEAAEIPFDYVNHNPIYKTRKPYYNILLDDKAGLCESFDTLNKLVTELETNGKK